MDRYHGVTYHYSNGRWEATLRCARRHRSLGLWPTAYHAALVYDERAIKVGGFPLNFPEVFRCSEALERLGHGDTWRRNALRIGRLMLIRRKVHYHEALFLAAAAMRRRSLTASFLALAPNTTHTPASLAALAIEELEAMVQGHPSKQDWARILAVDS